MKDDIFISESESINDALKKLNECGKKVLLVTDENRKLLGTLSDGDIRRYILSAKSLDNGVKEVYKRGGSYLKKSEYSQKKAKHLLVKNKVELLPVVNEKNVVVNYVTWSELFSDELSQPGTEKNVDVPVVVMAGGKGTRLDSFTKIFPKPLIPLGNHPIIEIIINEFYNQGVNHYYLTLNYKGEMIESYFNSIEKDYKLDYIWEKEFTGTAGSLKLLENDIDDVFIVSNCDVIVKADYEDVLKFHKRKNAAMTIISAIQHYKIPYGVTNFKKGGELINIAEKPEYTFTVNTGVYVLNKNCLKHIPENSFFDMPDLIEELVNNNKTVFTYPVNEKEYIDIGQWEEYRNALDQFQRHTGL